ncbi:MAG: 50S ribosomal protein L15 [Pseudobdellovibrionaceae bacterium]
MSLLSQLAPAEGATHYQKRIGRGRGSGLGQTAGKGNKGQLQRSGGVSRRGFEGGQTPLMRRLPKFGFTNVPFANNFAIVNVSQLEKFSDSVSPESLYEAGMLRKTDRLKVLGSGKITKKLTVKAHKFSASAKAAIEAVGGKAEVIS